MASSVFRLFSVLSTVFLLAAGDLSVAQQPPPPVPAPSPQQAEPLPPVDLEPADGRPSPPAPLVPPEQPIRLTFPNTSITEILSLYEVLTGKRLVRDSALAQGAPLTIVVPGEVPKSEAIRLIEASLLLNGYTFVPVDENTQKILGPTKFPRSEGIPIFSTPYTLPASDQVVSYFMKFSYLAPEQAVQLFQTFVSPPKAYTSFTPVPNVQAVLITENVPVIRKLISLQAMVDVPPAQVVTEFVTLKRADAEKVVEVLQSLVEKRDEGAPSAPGQPGQPQVDAQGQIIQATLATGGGAQFESNLIVGETQLAADPRTNRILVVTRPVNMPYIKKLIAELDAPVPLDAVLERPLKFVSAIDVLPVLSDLLSDGDTEGGGATTGRSGGDRAVIEGGTGTGQGIGSDGGLSTGGGTSRPDRIREPTEDGAPQSIIVGKTKIIADKSSNTIIVIGPPDSRQKAGQLLDMLDVRPRQVYIAAVIGELNLSDEMEFGFSYFLRYTSNGAGTGLAGSLINPLGLDPGNVLSGSNLPNPVDLIRPQLFQGLQGLTIYGTIADAVDVYARALEETGKFKVLSRPVVYTSNNKKAVISSGQQVPFVSSTLASSTITTQNTTGISSNITYKDVLLKLEVLPLINANKDVTLVIVQTKNDVLRFENLGGNLTPIIGSQELTTTVTVPSGGTVVLGGLIVERMEAGDAGVPFLMRIPVLGYLFKQNSRKVQRQELLVLLQPTVVENDADLAEASWQERYRSKIGDEAYAEAAPPAFANTPVVFDGQELESDSSVRKPRDPLRPAGWDYEEYAPEKARRPRTKQKAGAPQ
jgi:type II secretion system protein D